MKTTQFAICILVHATLFKFKKPARMISDVFSNLQEWSNDGMQKRVYEFSEGTINDSSILGEKGSYMCEMYKHHIPVPPGFIVSAEACRDFFLGNANLAPHLVHNLRQEVSKLEKQTKKKFICPESSPLAADTTMPLLLSVRSSPEFSLPGMTGSIINLGMNDRSCAMLAKHFDNTKFALDVHQRFLYLFGTLVMHVQQEQYDDVLTEARKICEVETNKQLDVAALQMVVQKFKALAEVPENPYDQLFLAVEAIFCSSHKHSAVVYRSLNDMYDGNYEGMKQDMAVIVQEMVFGNMNIRSCTGVAFSRDPESGEPFMTGEFVQQGQGEDVYRGLVAPTPPLSDGTQPKDIDKCGECGVGGNMLTSLDYLKAWGAVNADEVLSGGQLYCQLLRLVRQLETLFRDVQQVQFTVQDGELFVLQSGPASRTPRAAIQFAFQLSNEGLITEREAIMSLDAQTMASFDRTILHPLMLQQMTGENETSKSFSANTHVLGVGLGGVGVMGTVSGQAVFDAEAAQTCYQADEPCILIKQDASLDDLEAIALADGVVSLEGGASCHLVEISRPISRPCVVGVGATSGWAICAKTSPPSAVVLDSHCCGKGVYDAEGNLLIQEGQLITIDGWSGCVLDGEEKHRQEDDLGLNFVLQHLLRVADRFKNIQVFGDVSTPDEAILNVKLSSEGIMLVRLESLMKPDNANVNSATSQYLIDQSRVKGDKKHKEHGSDKGLHMNKSGSHCNRGEKKFSDKIRDENENKMHLQLPALPKQKHLIDSAEECLTRDLNLLYLSSPGTLVCVLLSSPQSSFSSSLSAALPIEVNLASLERVNTEHEQKRSSTRPLFVEDKVAAQARFQALNDVRRQSLQLQVRAVLQAGLKVINDAEKRLGLLQFLVPFRGGYEVDGQSEEATLISLIQATAQEVSDASGGVCVPYSIGVMVQTPRACLELDRVASKHPEVSTVMFDCDLLTEMIFGMNKVDTESLMEVYRKKVVQKVGGGDSLIFPQNPFERLDEGGVGSLLRRAVCLFRQHEVSKQSLVPMGCCGKVCCAHPNSVRFLLEGMDGGRGGGGRGGVDMDFLCGPPAILPIAKVAAAQSHIRALKRQEEVDDFTNEWTDADMTITSSAPFQSEFWY